ncbi:MAG: hypothetical protein J6L99_01590 [Ruminococcus sp.]|nr:hypothetical protein [Ruminococcus sp.]
MQSTQERKKSTGAKALLPNYSADLKKYDELYQQFCKSGYTKELCEAYAEAFLNNHKKPAPEDLVQIVRLYQRLHEKSSAEFYLNQLEERKLSGDDKFFYCIEALRYKSLYEHWRESEDFRTENINFMQIHSEKVDASKRADMYISLALTDCAAKHYEQALKLLSNFGYKPQGATDLKLLEIMITGVYILAKSGNKEELEGAKENAYGYLKLFSFDNDWSKAYYENCIEEAAEGIL